MTTVQPPQSNEKLMYIHTHILVSINKIACEQFDEWKLKKEQAPELCEYLQDIQYYLHHYPKSHEEESKKAPEGCLIISRSLTKNIYDLAWEQFHEWKMPNKMPDLCEHLQDLQCFLEHEEFKMVLN